MTATASVTDDRHSLDVRPLTMHIGAEVCGVDLRQAASVAGALHRALVDHGVLFVRDQHLSVAEQLAFASTFGPVNGADFAADGAVGDESSIDWVRDDPERPPGADYWHTDLPVWKAPPDVAVLCAEEVPAVGGDTLWLSLYEVYAGLSPVLQSMIRELEIEVGWSVASVVSVGRRRMVERQASQEASPGDSTIHPLVQVHPHSGRAYV